MKYHENVIGASSGTQVEWSKFWWGQKKHQLQGAHLRSSKLGAEKTLKMPWRRCRWVIRSNWDIIHEIGASIDSSGMIYNLLKCTKFWIIPFHFCFDLNSTSAKHKSWEKPSPSTCYRSPSLSVLFKSLVIPRHPVIPPEVWCFRYILGVQVPSQQVFGCLGNARMQRKLLQNSWIRDFCSPFHLNLLLCAMWIAVMGAPWSNAQGVVIGRMVRKDGINKNGTGLIPPWNLTYPRLPNTL